MTANMHAAEPRIRQTVVGALLDKLAETLGVCCVHIFHMCCVHVCGVYPPHRKLVVAGLGCPRGPGQGSAARGGLAELRRLADSRRTSSILNSEIADVAP